MTPSRVLVTIFDETSTVEAYRLAAELRRAGIRAAVYPESTKLMKQLKYADRMGIKLALIVGPDEVDAGQVTVKDLAARSQTTMNQADLFDFLSQWGVA